MARKPFYIHPRTLISGRTIYYFRAYRPDGTLTPWRSTHSETEEGALEFCYHRKALGTLHELNHPVAHTTPTFQEYFKDWWLWIRGEELPRCPLTRRKIQRKRKHSGFDYCSVRHSWLNKHFFPFFGPKKLDRIATKHVENWLDYLTEKELATGTIVTLLGQLGIMFREAVRLGDIQENPAEGIEGPTIIRAARDILTDEEIRSLFFKRTTNKLWEFKTVARAASLVALDTGSRLSEIRALRVLDFDLDSKTGPTVRIENGLSFNDDLKQTKTGRVDICLLSSETVKYVRLLISAATSGKQFVFSFDSGKTPCSKSAISDVFNAVICKLLDISDEERQERGIVFHSLRHGFITLMHNGYGLTAIKHEKDSSAEKIYIHADATRARAAAKTWFKERVRQTSAKTN